jgi:NADPH2:quinone reductase
MRIKGVEVMQGVVVREFGPIENHKLEEFPEPTPGPGDVLIDVHVVGVNFPDTLMIQGLYQTRPERPFVPGRDAAGVVAAVGENVTRFKPGDRVLAQVRWGAYGEQLAAPEERCFKVPDHVDFVTAGAMGTVFPTAHVSLLIRANYRTGETVLVNGAAGGIGLATVQITKAKGGTVIAGDISEEKRALATKYGADHTIDLAADDLRESLRQQVFAVTDGRGVDICMDPIGGDVFDASLRALAFEGRIVSVGYVAGRIPEAKANYFNVKNLTLIGIALDLYLQKQPETVWAAMEDLFELCRAGKVKPEVTAIHPISEFATVWSMFAAGKTKGKIVLTTDAGS